ncbi:MAG: hypothetical protein BWY63_03170 [Chloroflexi bacterium ADurb.Bin360]|nr:MAG: hypothetical protein BWY63_03170 [Chloroflexi bacterium ADurb.Bin360]
MQAFIGAGPFDKVSRLRKDVDRLSHCQSNHGKVGALDARGNRAKQQAQQHRYQHRQQKTHQHHQQIRNVDTANHDTITSRNLGCDMGKK